MGCHFSPQSTTAAPATCTKHVHLQVDNTTQWPKSTRGRTHSLALTSQALGLWAVTLNAGVFLKAQHILGILNSVADTVFKLIECRTEWTLDKEIFQSIC